MLHSCGAVAEFHRLPEHSFARVYGCKEAGRSSAACTSLPEVGAGQGQVRCKAPL